MSDRVLEESKESLDARVYAVSEGPMRRWLTVTFSQPRIS
jgi:hypothetical protein